MMALRIVANRLREVSQMKIIASAVAALLGLTAVIAGLYVWRERATPRLPGAVSFRVGERTLTLDARYLRARSAVADGQGAIEIVAFLPNFAPAGDGGDVTPATDLQERFRRLVFLKLRPADATLDPAERTSRLYARFLSEVSWSHPGGLIARAFVDGSPFEGDELFYLAPEGRQFAARCRKPAPDPKTPNTCMSAFRTHGLDVEVRFSASQLSDWELLTNGAKGLVEAALR